MFGFAKTIDGVIRAHSVIQGRLLPILGPDNDGGSLPSVGLLGIRDALARLSPEQRNAHRGGFLDHMVALEQTVKACLSKDPKARPSIADLMWKLQGIVAAFKRPSPGEMNTAAAPPEAEQCIPSSLLPD